MQAFSHRRLGKLFHMMTCRFRHAVIKISFGTNGFVTAELTRFAGEVPTLYANLLLSNIVCLVDCITNLMYQV